MDLVKTLFNQNKAAQPTGTQSQSTDYTSAANSADAAADFQTPEVIPMPNSDGPLKTDRSLVPYILLSIITCGIYSYYFIYKMAKDVNVACYGDGKETAGLVKFILLSIITCSIYAWFWYYNLANRLQENAPRYGLSFTENGTTVLLWLIVGSCLCGIGAFVAMHILIKNTNAICAAYNDQVYSQAGPQV